MAYKRNPMRCERTCSLAKFLMGMQSIASATHSTQWLERTLDDSAVRRLSLPQAFLCADAIVKLLDNINGGLTVNKVVIDRNVKDHLPYIATDQGNKLLQ